MVQSPQDQGSVEIDGRPGVLENPPAERLWQHYSPHHELPLSGISSLAVHGVLFALLVIGGLVVSRILGKTDNGPSLGVVALAGDSGDPAAASGGGALGPAKEVVPSALSPTSAPPAGGQTDLQPPQPKALDVLPAEEGIRPAPADDAPTQLRQLKEDAGRQLQRFTEDRKTQPGRPGNPNTGPPGGPGGAPRINSERQQRLLRWTMTFNTTDGIDYLRQLKALGAILAYRGADGKYTVIRDLDKRPARGQAESIDDMNRIYWIDDRGESVKSLAKALQVIPPPKAFVAFFPERLEKELLRKELAYEGRKEESIHETKFTVKRTPSGYEPEVASQTVYD